ncbi:hypothetical protein HOY80DRAFT_675747 [Tuber brumale]|nr:hypothetical protein HOY80DRAFT_675747 [Tuber brumale]
MKRTCVACVEHARHVRHAFTLIRSRIRSFRCPLLYSPFGILSFMCTVRSPVYRLIVRRLASGIHKNGHATYRLPPSPPYDCLPFRFRRIRFTVRIVRSWFVRVFVRGRSWSVVLERSTIAAEQVETGTGTAGNWEGRNAAWQRESLWSCLSFVSLEVGLRKGTCVEWGRRWMGMNDFPF